MILKENTLYFFYFNNTINDKENLVAHFIKKFYHIIDMFDFIDDNLFIITTAGRLTNKYNHYITKWELISDTCDVKPKETEEPLHVSSETPTTDFNSGDDVSSVDDKFLDSNEEIDDVNVTKDKCSEIKKKINKGINNYFDLNKDYTNNLFMSKKTFDKKMDDLEDKIRKKKGKIKELENEKEDLEMLINPINFLFNNRFNKKKYKETKVEHIVIFMGTHGYPNGFSIGNKKRFDINLLVETIKNLSSIESLKNITLILDYCYSGNQARQFLKLKDDESFNKNLIVCHSSLFTPFAFNRELLFKPHFEGMISANSIEKGTKHNYLYNISDYFPFKRYCFLFLIFVYYRDYLNKKLDYNPVKVYDNYVKSENDSKMMSIDELSTFIRTFNYNGNKFFCKYFEFIEDVVNVEELKKIPIYSLIISYLFSVNAWTKDIDSRIYPQYNFNKNFSSLIKDIGEKCESDDSFLNIYRFFYSILKVFSYGRLYINNGTDTIDNPLEIFNFKRGYEFKIDPLKKLF
jgi:hypothetical protein